MQLCSYSFLLLEKMNFMWITLFMLLFTLSLGQGKKVKQLAIHTLNTLLSLADVDSCISFDASENAALNIKWNTVSLIKYFSCAYVCLHA